MVAQPRGSSRSLVTFQRRDAVVGPVDTYPFCCGCSHSLPLDFVIHTVNSKAPLVLKNTSRNRQQAMSFPQKGLGDVMTAVTTVWTIYKNVKEGPASASADFKSFRQEFGAIKGLLEQNQKTKQSTFMGERDLGVFYNQTIDECAEFIYKNRQLTQNQKTSNGRRNSFGTEAIILFEKVTWPLERDEAERLRRKLERCLKIAMLKSSQETRDATFGFMKATENNRMENLEMLKSIKYVLFPERVHVMTRHADCWKNHDITGFFTFKTEVRRDRFDRRFSHADTGQKDSIDKPSGAAVRARVNMLCFLLSSRPR
ncbi:hypothetical protein BP00DRAFT_149351 [Aspergillus indologenus CBS 114.80]|uniref:Uncharacterized protein n=1 Tax=Aspergillus indologenus CBS 114.80 TaxID=1450541 RepID=A0A2V5ILJ6_9EURO|nr:hypothetical protein BP00DRAFT_149351 [Aspergillus indologenus CBS 114.80]